MAIAIPVETMSVAEKLEALETIWASLCSNPTDVHSPPWHRVILEERDRRLASGEAIIVDWNEAKKRLQELGS